MGRDWFSGGTTVYRCTRGNFIVLRRAARVASRRSACEIEVTCPSGKHLDVNFSCKTQGALEKSFGMFFSILDRSVAEGQIAPDRSLGGARR